MNRPSINEITSDQLDALYAEVERGRRAEAHLLHFTAEAHRRKWDYDLGLDDDGQPIGSPAFNALHRLGDEMNAALHKLRASTKPTEGVAA
ncbi:hypothetical protein ACWGJ6_23355 [Streptomyces canus]